MKIRYLAVAVALSSLCGVAETPKGLAQADWTGIRAEYQRHRQAFFAADGGFHAHNDTQHWTTRFDNRNFSVQPDAGAWKWGLQLDSYGFPGHEHAIKDAAKATADVEKLTYLWDPNITEWLVNGSVGLEHGFTLTTRPGLEAGKPLMLHLSVLGTLTPLLSENGRDVSFVGKDGAALVKYNGLKVTDAAGHPVSARFVREQQGLRLELDESAAVYPLTIDPTAVTVQQAHLQTAKPQYGSDFGGSVAISGDTVVIGAPGESSNATGVNGDPSNTSAAGSGAAYVFVRNGNAWSQQAYLKASNTDANDLFGGAVSISGDTIVVGAFQESSNASGVNGDQSDNSNHYAGAAYVFVRNGVTWSQQAYLKASNTAADTSPSHFGASVVVSDNTIVVGAPYEDGKATGVNGNQNDQSSVESGAAYVFVRSGNTWAQQAYLKASNSYFQNFFGNSVALSADTLVVGSFGEASANTGINGTLPQGQINFPGAAYVFVRNGNNWSQQAFLKASNTRPFAYFGRSVGVSGDTAVIGSNGESSGATGVNGDQTDSSASGAGAAYVFVRNGSTWGQQAYLKASDTTANDGFGNSVAASGETVAIATIAGKGYLFARSGTTWSQQSYLTASNTTGLGNSVALDGGTVISGAPTESGSAGAAYVFVTGSLPIASLGIPSLDFGTVGIGVTSGANTVTLTNTGQSTLTPSAVAIAGTGFAIQSENCTGAQLGPSAKCSASVTFTPTTSAAASGLLTFSDNSATGPTQAVTLSGAGIGNTQAITFPSISTQTVGAPLTLTATATSNLPVSYLSLSSTHSCTLSGATATFSAPGGCTITAFQDGNSNYAAAMQVTQTFAVVSGGQSTTFISGQTPGPARNNYSGFVGFKFTVGSNPIAVYSLERITTGGYVVFGAHYIKDSHLVKLVQANGVDVPGGSVTVFDGNAVIGAYSYALLSAPVTLLANTSYFLVSQETAGYDIFYDYGPVNSTNAAQVVAPVYTDAFNTYIPVGGLPGQSYVPVNFLYSPPTTALSVNITSPSPAATISGAASISVSTTGALTSLQIQVDGANQGSPVSVSVNQGPNYTLSLDTTVLATGQHVVTVLAANASAQTAVSAGVQVVVNNPPGGTNPFVNGQTLGPLRNNYTGFVGFSMVVGSSPVVVKSLGRFAAPGNSGTHLMKLVDSNGLDVPGGSVSVSMSGATAGTFKYASLSGGVTLQPHLTYFVVSQETTGADQWYDYGAISTAPIATSILPAYTDGANHYVSVGGIIGYSYVPVSFLYGPAANTLSVSINSPQSGALVSGKNVPIVVSTTGGVTTLQLQVDGVNQGPVASAGPLTFDTTTIGNGQHTLTVAAGDGTSIAVSPGIAVTINNGGGPITALITSETPSYLRNNYGDFVGLALKVGATPLSVTALGRIFVTGNTGSHALKLVQANGVDVPGGSVNVSLAGGTVGQFVYGTLASPVALLANTTYYLVSQETSGGDMWFDLEPVTSTSAAQVTGPVYRDGQGHFILVSGLGGYSYVPVSLLYQ